MPKQRLGLGRGLDALIPGNAPVAEETLFDAAVASSAGLVEVPVGAITPNPDQPRRPIDEDEGLDELATLMERHRYPHPGMSCRTCELIELAASIQEHGLLQPLLVARAATDENGLRYQLIAGERRWRAARLAGLERVPVLVRDSTPQSMLEMALVENLQRSDLNPLEAAQGYAKLIDEYGLTQDEVAQRVGRERSTVANTLRLLQLPAEVREKLITLPRDFTEGHARAVLQIPGNAERIEATKQIITQKLNVRQAEELARRYAQASVMLAPDRRGGKTRPQNYETRVLEEEFTRAVQMKVRLQRTTKGKGSLTLYFASEDQLDLLYQWLVAARAAAGGLEGGADLLGIETVDMRLPRLAERASGGGNGNSGADDDDSLDDELFDMSYDEQ
jgi:ParB family chromosome partitioning protein